MRAKFIGKTVRDLPSCSLGTGHVPTRSSETAATRIRLIISGFRFRSRDDGPSKSSTISSYMEFIVKT